jgi:lipopolysaccharide transport system permease protein
VSRTLALGGRALVSQRHGLSKVYFPRLLVPLSIVLTCVVDHVVSLSIVAVAVARSDLALTWRLSLLPALMLWTMALALAATLVVAAVSVRRRDALTALPIAIQVWLYVSPVAYPLSSVSGSVRDLMVLNPLTPLIEAHRWAVTGSSEVGATAMIGGALGALVLLVLALAAFRVAERSMADVL